MRINQVIGGRGDYMHNKNVTEERSHICVEEVERSTEKVFKYHFFTYVNILGPEPNKKV